MLTDKCVLLLYLVIFTGTNQKHYAAGNPVLGYEYIQHLDVWLRLHIEPATWPDARLRCHLEGGVLASPTDSGLASEMLAMMAARLNAKPRMTDQDQNHITLKRVFTGINAVVAKGYLMTMEGVPVSNISLPWAEGEPNNENNNEDCVAMNGAGELVDVPCSTINPFFCKKQSDKCGTTDNEYKMEPRTGSCYKFHLVPRTWHQAAAACFAEGGHLAIINSATESQVLKELFAQHPDNTIRGANFTHVAIIGFWDWNEHTRRNVEWLTIFGETLRAAGFEVWSKNEPNNAYGIEYCGSIVRDGLLNDYNCELSAVFICEINPK